MITGRLSQDMKIVFMGTPDFAASILSALFDAGYMIEAAVSQPDKPVGRHAELRPTAVKMKAEELGIPVLQPEKASDPDFIDKLKAMAPDVIVVAAYGKILKPELLNIPRYGCINVHASLLPKWRGAAPIQWAVIAGDREAGVTTMMMNEGLDTGDMLLRSSIPVAEDETGGSLFDKLAELGSRLIVDTLKALSDGSLRAEKQDDGKATYAPMLKKEMGNIDWNMPAADIERLVRGLCPWPGTFTFSKGKMIKIHKVSIPDEEKTAELCKGTYASGDVITGDGSIYVICGSGALRIDELQAEGKKRMTAGDYLKGNNLERFEHER